MDGCPSESWTESRLQATSRTLPLSGSGTRRRPAPAGMLAAMSPRDAYERVMDKLADAFEAGEPAVLSAYEAGLIHQFIWKFDAEDWFDEGDDTVDRLSDAEDEGRSAVLSADQAECLHQCLWKYNAGEWFED